MKRISIRQKLYEATEAPFVVKAVYERTKNPRFFLSDILMKMVAQNFIVARPAKDSSSIPKKGKR